MGIKRLEIAGFKSIDSVTLTDLPNYCVFAGANGAGKSNFFDALKFASAVIDDGAIKAIRQFHGYDRIRCVKRSEKELQNFHFGCNVDFSEISTHFLLDGYQMDREPELQEQITIGIPGNKPKTYKRGRDGTMPLNAQTQARFAKYHSALSGWFDAPSLKVPNWFKNFKVFRVDPFRAKEPDDVGAYPHYLDEYGRNLSTVLETMQENEDDYETIMDWMSMIVPGLARIHPQRNPLNGTTSIVFQETGTTYHFPPGLISDGTIYVLCLLTAVLTRIKKPGITMIEEPERGIHPQAIEQLSLFFREHASDEHQIFISTHNESFVRNAKAEELFFAVKKDGRTQFRLGRDTAKSVEGMPNDKAWLQNMFNGGLPW